MKRIEELENALIRLGYTKESIEHEKD
jgi:hypothetical protein